MAVLVKQGAMQRKSMSDRSSQKRIILSSFFVVALLFTFKNETTAQKLKSDDYKISLKSISKKMTRFHSKVYSVYNGTVKVTSKDSLKGIYQFSLLNLGDSISSFTIRNSSHNLLRPKLNFNKGSYVFSYRDPDQKLSKYALSEDLSIENVLLNGILFWLKIKSESPKKL